MFILTSDIIQGKWTGKYNDDGSEVEYDLVVASGSTWEKLWEHAVIGTATGAAYSVHDLPGELVDLIEADLRVEFNKAYQEALESSS